MEDQVRLCARYGRFSVAGKPKVLVTTTAIACELIVMPDRSSSTTRTACLK